MPTTLEGLSQHLLYNSLPIGAIVPWLRAPGADVPLGWELCDGTGKTAPDLRNLFLRGAGQTGLGKAGGSDTAHISIAGSNGAVPNGDGWSKNDDHFVAGYDIATIPRHFAVVFIMKVSNLEYM